jgi:hypothetical protein
VLVDGRKTPTEPMRLIGRDDYYGEIGHSSAYGTEVRQRDAGVRSLRWSARNTLML